jgi:hypothetical protein
VIGGAFDADAVFVAAQHVMDMQVADHDVARAHDLDADAVELGAVACADDRYVPHVLDVDLLHAAVGFGDRTGHQDGERHRSVLLLGERVHDRSAGARAHGAAAFAAGRAAVLCRPTDEREVGLLAAGARWIAAAATFTGCCVALTAGAAATTRVGRCVAHGRWFRHRAAGQ